MQRGFMGIKGIFDSISEFSLASQLDFILIRYYFGHYGEISYFHPYITEKIYEDRNVKLFHVIKKLNVKHHFHTKQSL